MRTADAKNFRRAHLIPPNMVENALRVPPFQLIDGHQDLIIRITRCRLGLHSLRQIANIDHIRFGHHAGMLDDVLELADIARPRVSRQDSLGPPRKSSHGFVVLNSKSL